MKIKLEINLTYWALGPSSKAHGPAHSPPYLVPLLLQEAGRPWHASTAMVAAMACVAAIEPLPDAL